RSWGRWPMAETAAILPERYVALPARVSTRPYRAAASESRHAIALVAPAVGLMLVLLFGPTAAALVISCTDWEFGAAVARFVGLGNFRALAADPVFWKSFGNTLIYVAVVVPACVGGGLALALLIESRERFR